MGYLFLGERFVGRVGSKPSPLGGCRSWGEEVVEEGLVDCSGGVGFREGGEPTGFPG